MAARVGSEWGSARYALDILIEAGCNAINENKDKIGQDDVDTAIHQLELTVFKTKIKLLPPSVFAFLEGLYRHRDQKIITTWQAIEYYNQVCNEADIYPIKERKLKDIMAELQEDGLISRTLQSTSSAAS